MRSFFVHSLTALLLFSLACGVSQQEHRRTLEELDAASGELEAAKKRITELETEVQRLRETDEAYWAEILAMNEGQQWNEVRAKATELLSRWPDSSYSDDARRSIQQATEAMAQQLYEQAQKALEEERFEAAKTTLTKVQAEFPGTPVHSRAVADLRDMDKLIERARRRAVGNGKWRTSSEISKIDDSTNVYLSLPADDTIPGRLGGETRPTLWVRCKENRTEVFVTWDVYLGIDTTRVLQRFDKESARTRTWGISTDHTATFYHGNHIVLARDLMSHDQVLLQLTPYGERPVTATFSLAGLENAIGELREACKW